MGKFIVRKDEDGYKFDFFASSGVFIASSEPYATETACMAGIEGLVRSAPKAGLNDLTNGAGEKGNPKFEVYKDNFGHYRFRLLSPNGKVVAVSEGFINKDSCQNVIDMVRKNSTGSTIDIQS